MSIIFKVVTVLVFMFYSIGAGKIIYKENNKITKKLILPFLGFFILTFLLMFVVDLDLSLLFLCFLYVPIIKSVFNKNLVNIAFLSFILYLIRIVVDFLFMICFRKFGYGFFDFRYFTLDKVQLNILFALVSLVIVYISRNIIIKVIKRLSNFRYSYSLVMFLFTFDIFLILLMRAMYLEVYISTFIDYCLILTFTFLFTALIDKDCKLNSISQYYKDIFEYSRINDELNLTYRMKVHENKNQLIIIKSMLKDKKYKELKKYIDGLLDAHEKDIRNYWLSDLAYIPLPGVKNFLNNKLIELKEMGTVIEVFVSRDIESIDTKKFSSEDYRDLTTILGVVLDNMIENIRTLDKRLVSINIYLDDDFIIGEFANNFKGKIELEKLFKLGYSTKGGQHGVGLALVNNIISSNKLLNCKPSVVDNFFIQTISVKIKK